MSYLFNIELLHKLTIGSKAGLKYFQIVQTTCKNRVLLCSPDALYVLDTPTVMGIAFAAFVIGALLTGALWFIYSHTGRSFYLLLHGAGSPLHVNEKIRCRGMSEPLCARNVPLGLPNILLLTGAGSQ